MFHPPASGRITISQNPNPVLDAGPTLQQGQAPLEYAFDNGYSGVTGPWYAIASAAGVIVGITEVFGTWPFSQDAGGRPEQTQNLHRTYPQSQWAAMGGYQQGA